jgi:hypothetical protein
MDQGKRLHNVRCEPFLYNERSVYAIMFSCTVVTAGGLNNKIPN